ncbi:GNAT family N-acetyltransferase [Phenylobacterium sp.]|uniref:GNAT family N-acetyltransferase n=1 Tax=Phenylobacterium sp. TaxID=1871053 RepID=UPI002735F272|nr:GNAT family N-acetyltransferase [Phenylobacterium sp.]MDP3854667.1 GNAT family N-acetyltransferase [Phenylobacterium sp.]
MRLRGAWGHEADALAGVHGRAFSGGWAASEIAGLLDGPGGFALLIEEAEPLAFILCRAVAGEAEILTLAVDPAARRRGLALALVEAATGAARMAGAQTLFLEVAHDNAAARGLYAKAGFQEVGLRRGYYDRGPNPPANAVVMRLDLGPSA